MLRILLAAGGTGGHIFPAVAVAQALQRLHPGTEVHFAGSGTPMEQKLAAAHGFPLHVVRFRPLAGKGVRGALLALAALPGALRNAARLMRELKPQVIVAFGGYPSVIPAVIGRLFRIPLILQEQNVQVGYANRLLSLLAAEIYAVPSAAGFPSWVKPESLTNPVRASFLDIPDWQEPAGEGMRLLIVGGSQGAVTLNTAVLNMLSALHGAGVFIVHQTGELDLVRVKDEYRRAGWTNVEVLPFIDDMAAAYKAADLVLCRAGALTVAEVTAAGRPAVYVPLRIAGGHQAKNAAHAAQAGAALIVEQSDDLPLQLAELIPRLLTDPEKLRFMAGKARELSRASGMPAAEYLARRAAALALRDTEKEAK